MINTTSLAEVLQQVDVICKTLELAYTVHHLNESKKGKYISQTLKIEMPNKATMEKFYLQAAEIEGVVTVL